MKINKFKKLKDNRYEIFLDDTSIILYDDVIINHELLLKRELDKKRLDEIVKENNELSAYYLSIKYINKRQRSKKEITSYLNKLNFNITIIDKTIKKLTKEGFINNKTYMNSYINDQILLTNNGPYKISNYLLSQGFEENEIFDILNNYDDEIWLNRINQIINKRSKLNKNNNKIFKEKTYYYLINLGYEREMINSLLIDIKVVEDSIILKDIEKLKLKYSKKYSKDKLNYFIKQKLYAKGYKEETINKYL